MYLSISSFMFLYLELLLERLSPFWVYKEIDSCLFPVPLQFSFVYLSLLSISSVFWRFMWNILHLDISKKDYLVVATSLIRKSICQWIEMPPYHKLHVLTYLEMFLDFLFRFIGLSVHSWFSIMPFSGKKFYRIF